MAEWQREYVTRMIEALNDKDAERALGGLPDDFVMDWSNSIGPLKGVYAGQDELRQVWSSFSDAFESFEWEPQEYVEVDEARLIVVNTARVRGLGSGVEVTGTGAQLWTFEDGVPRSFKLYQTKEEAMEALEEAD